MADETTEERIHRRLREVAGRCDDKGPERWVIAHFMAEDLERLRKEIYVELDELEVRLSDGGL